MPVTKIEDDVFECSITTSTNALLSTHPEVVSLLNLCVAMNNTVGMERISFIHDSQNADHYAYYLKASDGREWSQDVHVSPPDEADMTFSVPSHWKLSEFALQRPIRDVFVGMAAEHPGFSATVEFA